MGAKADVAPPPSTAPAAQPCSRLALVAYAVGLVPVLGVAALPLGAVALWRIARGGRVGRPVAWGAMGLGALWAAGIGWWTYIKVRSEEHTSELQSQSNLVCRLLLEKIN